MDPKTGLYSKAAQIIRSYPQRRATAEEILGYAKNGRGLKEPEIEHAGELPKGVIDRDELANIFEARKPRLQIDQYGENPSYLSRDEQKELRDLSYRNYPLTPEEEARSRQLGNRLFSGPNVLSYTDDDGEEELLEPEYGGYASNGTQNYRERLLKLEGGNKDIKVAKYRHDRALGFRNSAQDRVARDEVNYGPDHPITQQSRDILAKHEAHLQEQVADLDRLKTLHGEPRQQPKYQSSHWNGHPNVLAHIRLSDREIVPPKEQIEDILQRMAAQQGLNSWKYLASGAVGPALIHKVITPEEAAEVSRFMGWRNGYDQGRGIGKRLLHVEELQSDWAQEGRDQGFHDPQNPFEIFDTKTGKTISKHPTYSAMWDAYRSIPEDQAAGLDYGNAADEKRPPAAPYVTNTQHWTDLALKNVLREAALGNYDGIVFPTGQNQADRYGLEKQVKSLSLKRPQDGGGFGRLTAQGHNGRPVFDDEIKDASHLQSLVGKDVADRLLSSQGVVNYNDRTVNHYISGNDLKMGGEGMRGYYDNIVPKAVMKLARQHDPDIKLGEPVTYREGDNEYQGFHLPMTEDLKNSILDKGFPAFKRGGRVGKANGGSTDEDAGASAAAPTAQGAVPNGRGVRGGAGLLQAPDEAPLEGLPQSVRIPITGQVIQAGPDPRIRSVARSYMQQAGLPYNPPTKYAKVDPARARRIAKAYDAMTDDADDPLTRASYAAMIKETLAQYEAAKAAGFKAEFWNPRTQRDPYEASPRLAVEDVRNNHHMWVYPTYDGYGSAPITEEDARKNPMLQLTGETWNGIPVTVNDIFRAVHDYFGHAKEGVGFRHDGEENAWRSHASMYSPLARLAMTSETRGQNSWLNFGPHGAANQNARTEDTVFAPQKVGILPHWVHHEGAEDFMGPEEVEKMRRVRAKYSGEVAKALELSRRFTTGGVDAILKPKS